MKVSGIYIIQSISKPERVYVGSAIDLRKRKNMHLHSLRQGTHHSPQLQRHYSKYGLEDLAFEPLESGTYLDKNHLLAREQGWFDHFKYLGTNLPYFNVVPMAGSRLGVKESVETNRKNSERNKNKVMSQISRDKISKALSDKPKTKEHNANVSASLMGHSVSQVTRDKLKLLNTGSTRLPITESTRFLQRVAQAKAKGVKISAVNIFDVFTFASIGEATRVLETDKTVIKRHLRNGKPYRNWYLSNI